MTQAELEVQGVTSLEQALRMIACQLGSGDIDGAKDKLDSAIVDAKLLKTLLKNRPNNAEDNLESQQL